MYSCLRTGDIELQLLADTMKFGKLVAAAALFIVTAFASMSIAAASHTINSGNIVRASQGGYTICHWSQLADATSGHAFGSSTTATWTGSSCGGTLTSGASVKATDELFHKVGSSWTSCSNKQVNGYKSWGSIGVDAFNTLSCGSGTYLNLAQSGGWITGTEYPATHWPYSLQHTGY